MGDLMLAFCGVEFFLQVYMTDFNSFRRGEFKVVRSLRRRSRMKIIPS